MLHQVVFPFVGVGGGGVSSAAGLKDMDIP